MQINFVIFQGYVRLLVKLPTNPSVCHSRNVSRMVWKLAWMGRD
jgi:hypothetical protein